MVNRTRQGAASIYVVAITALLFVIIVISFVRIISSDSGKTSEDIISQNAYDAAMSGIEDAKIALSSYYNCLKYKQDNKTELYESSGCPNIVAEINNSMNAANEEVYDAEKSCDGITKALGRNGFSGSIPNGGPVNIRNTTSPSDGPSLDQAYTCITIANSLSDYRSYLSPSSSMRLVPLAPDSSEESSNITHVRISWFTRENAERSGIKQRAGGSYLEPDNFLSSTDGGVAFRSKIGEEKSLLPPVLAVQFFQFPASGIDLWSSDDTSSLGSNRGEVWLVPKHPGDTKEGNPLPSAGENVLALSNNHYDGMPNSPYTVECDSAIRGDFACSAILALPTPVDSTGNVSTRLDNSKGGATFLNISMPYGDNISDFSIELCTDSFCNINSTTNFKDVQISVDSTGRTNDFYRRVETRMELRDISFPVTSNAVSIADSEDASLEKNFWVTKNCWRVVNGVYNTCDTVGTDDVSSGRYVEYSIKYKLSESCSESEPGCTSPSFPTQTITKTGNQPTELDSAKFTIHSGVPSSDYEFLYWESDTGEKYSPGEGITLTRPEGSTDKHIELTLHAVWGSKKYYAFSKSGSGSYIYIKKLDDSGTEVSDVISGSTILHSGDKIKVHYGINSATSSSCGSSLKYHPTINKFFALGQENTYYSGSGEETISDTNERVGGPYTVTDSNLYFLTEDLSSQKFTITYDKNSDEAEGTMPIQEVPCDAITTTLLDNAYTYTNHNFLGWYTSKEPSADEVPLTSLHVNEDMVVYAKWGGAKVKLVISDEGTKTSVEKRLYDESTEATNATSGTDLPVASGYEFERGETIRFRVSPDTCYNPASMKSEIYLERESNPRESYNASFTTLEAEGIYNEDNELIGTLPERLVYSLGGSYVIGDSDSGTLYLNSSAQKYTYSITYKSGDPEAKLITGSGNTWVDPIYNKTCGESNYSVRDSNGLFEFPNHRFVGWEYSRNIRTDAGTREDTRIYLEKATCGSECDASDYYLLPADYNQDVVLTAKWIRQYSANFYQNASDDDTKVVTWTMDKGSSFTFPSLSTSGFTDFKKGDSEFKGWSIAKTSIVGSLGSDQVFNPGDTSSLDDGSKNFYAIWKQNGPGISGCDFMIYYGTGTNITSESVSSNNGAYTIDTSRPWTIVFTKSCSNVVLSDVGNVDIFMLGGGYPGSYSVPKGIASYSYGGNGGKRATVKNVALNSGSYKITIGGAGSDSSFGSNSSSGGTSSAGGSQTCGCDHEVWGIFYEDATKPQNGGYAFDDSVNGIGVSGTTGTRYGGGGGAGDCIEQCFNNEHANTARSGKDGGGNGCVRHSTSSWSKGTNGQQYYGGGGGGMGIGAWWTEFYGLDESNGYSGALTDSGGSGSSGFVAIRNHR